VVDALLAPAAESDSWSHHCTACGKCCNSPPQMTLPELFHHQQRFIGALGVRRVHRPLTAHAAEHADLATRVLHESSNKHFALLTQAIDYASSERCPALLEDGLCAIHDTRKPRACSVVPLDALLPDSMQYAVLATRTVGGAEYIGADCIVPGERSGFREQTRLSALTDPLARQALEDHRHDLAADKRFWGNAVFGELQRDVLSHREGLASIPVVGVLTLPLAPVLLVLADVSSRCRQRCIEYLEAQISLMENSVAHALQRRLTAERPFTAQLRSFVMVARQLLQGLQLSSTRHRAANADEIEAWLGLNMSH
jgi:Fe-S-cluster containining protein